MRLHTLAAFVVLSCAAHAQSKDDDAKQAAKIEFEKGMALSSEGKYVDALRAFETSRALYPTRTNTQNLALTMERLGRFTDALEMLEQLIRDFPDTSEEQRRAIEIKRSEILKNIGKLEIITLDGAEVEVDGRARGSTPLEHPVLLNPGRHELRVSKAGVGSATISVDIAAQQVLRIVPKLEPARVARAEPTRKKARSSAPAAVPPEVPAKMHFGFSPFAVWGGGHVEGETVLSDRLLFPGFGMGLDLAYGSRAFIGGYFALALMPSICYATQSDTEDHLCSAENYRAGIVAGWRSPLGSRVRLTLAVQLGQQVLVLDTSEGYFGWQLSPFIVLDYELAPKFRLGPAATYSAGSYSEDGQYSSELHWFLQLGIRGEFGW